MMSLLVALLRHPLALLSVLMMLFATPGWTAHSPRLDRNEGPARAQAAIEGGIRDASAFRATDSALTGAEWRSSDFEPEKIALQELPEHAALLAWWSWSPTTLPLRLPEADPRVGIASPTHLRWCSRSARGPPVI